ncbi:MAG: hypothetical protein CMA39_02620 [Euryarchaeota archaeon]|nr:hypothetical protein [Euryarchaeota archaeon]
MIYQIFLVCTITLMENECDPVYAKVDELLDLITKSKSLHILLELHLANRQLSFTELKKRVEAASTTVSRRLTELEEHALIERNTNSLRPNSASYSLTEKSMSLAPIIQSMYDWCEAN